MVKTKWSIQDVREIFNELDKITGADSSNVEIKINGRLKRALARYTCYNNPNRTPVKFDFGTDIMNVPSFKALKDVAIHEYVHFIVNTVRKSDNMGHSAEFRQVCKELGTNNYNSVCTSFVSNQVKAAKYGIDLDLLNEVFEEETPVEELPVQEEIPTAAEPEVQPTAAEETPEEQPKQHKKGRTIGKFDLDGNLLEKGKRAYWKEQGMPLGNISKCANGKLKTCKGYVWRYLD